MAREVNRRSYDGTRRQAQSADTRDRILAAARALLMERGYGATPVTAIADRAGVHLDTVYTLVGRKPDLLRELIGRAVSGTDRSLPPEERDYVQAIRAEPDARRKLDIYAAAVVRTQQQLAPLYKVIREAAPSAPEVATLWRQISDRRLANMHEFVTDLETAEPLRPGLTRAQAAHHVWALNSPDMYLLLTADGGWSSDQVSGWLSATWERLLFA